MTTRAGLGQLPDLMALAQPGLLYIKVSSPLGVAIVDPFAASQDGGTQSILQRLGIGVTIGFGPAPAPEPGETLLADTLAILLPVAISVVAYWIRPRASTLLVTGGASLLWHAYRSGAFAPAPEVAA